MAKQFTEKINLKPKQDSDSLNNFIRIYLDFSYFICFIPFRLIVNENGYGFRIHTRLPQQIICGMFHVLGIAIMIAEFRKAIPSTDEPQNVVQYFQIVSEFFWICYLGLCIKSFWFQKNRYLNLVNFISRNAYSLPNCSVLRMRNKTLTLTICFISFFLMCWQIFQQYLLAPESQWNETVWNRELVIGGHYLFFMKHDKKVNVYNLTTLDYFVTIVCALAWIGRRLIGFYVDLGLVFASFTFWTTVKAFKNSIKVDIEHPHLVHVKTPNIFMQTTPIKRSLPWKEIYSTFQTIRYLCKAINAVYGNIITIYIGATQLFYTMSFDHIIKTGDTMSRFLLFFFFCIALLFQILSADACNKLEVLREWLTIDENRRVVPADQLKMVLHELQIRAVGIRGSEMFTISYPVLWNILTTSITYFIIRIQSIQTEQH